MKFTYIFLIILLFPNICYAYIDPNIFTIIWQVLAAFAFSMFAYSKLVLSQIRSYIKSIKLFFPDINKFYFQEIYFCTLVIAIPIIGVLSKDNNVFERFDIIIAISFQFLILMLIWVFNYLIIKNSKNSLIASCLIFLSIQLYGFFEGIIITNFVNSEVLKYFRILSLLLITFSIIIFLLNVRKINFVKFSKYFVFFLSTLLFIILANNFFNKSNNQKKKIWQYEEAKIIKNDNLQNVFILFTDSYVSPDYFKKLYNKKNKLFNYLRKNDFVLKQNSYSNYSSTFLSLPSLYNSNYYKSINKEILRKNLQLIDESFTMQSLLKNDYSHNLYKCYYKYENKSKFCKKLKKFQNLNKDLNLVEAIYYYNSLYAVFRHAKKNLNVRILNNFIFKEGNDTIKKDLAEIITDQNNKKTFTTLVFNKPHAPYVFNKNCNWEKLSYYDLTVNSFLIKDHDKRINGYYHNVKCVNRDIIYAIENIKENDNEALIVIISDNGPLLRPNKLIIKNQIELTRKDKLALDYNSSIFAISKNFKCEKMLNEINLVNTFRVIFNCNAKIMNPILPKKIYVSEINKILETFLYFSDE